MPEPTLDDVALYLLQLEPDDRAELGRAREQLAAMALANRTPIAAQPYVAGAVRALGPLADGTAPDPAAAVREVGRLLERAVTTVSVRSRAQRAAWLPGELVEELVVAQAAFGGDEAVAALARADRGVADKAARVLRAVRELQALLPRDGLADVGGRFPADLGRH